jgi:hypothetical protein
MSAFVVSKTHIDALVSVAIYGPTNGESQWRGMSWSRPCEPYAPSPDYPQYTTSVRWMTLATAGLSELAKRDDEITADELGFILWAENVASVSYRYPDDTPETLPGTMVQTEAGMVAECTQGYKFERMFGRQPTAVEALKLIACLDYQSCEHEGWKDSEAFRILEGLKDALINQLAGYSAASWEWNE